MGEVTFRGLVDGKLSMKILDENPDGSVPYNRAIFIVPHRRNGGEEIHVRYLAIAPALIVQDSKKGMIGHYFESWPEKNVTVASDRDLEQQMEGYLGLLRMTEGRPVSVVVVDNPRHVPLDVILSQAMDRYVGKFMEANAGQLNSAIKDFLREEYGLGTFRGIFRRVTGNRVTCIYAHDSDTFRRVIEANNPSHPIYKPLPTAPPPQPHASS